MRKRFHELHGLATVGAQGRRGSVGRHAVNMALVSSGVLIEINCPETGALLPVTYRADSARANVFRNASRATADETRQPRDRVSIPRGVGEHPVRARRPKPGIGLGLVFTPGESLDCAAAFPYRALCERRGLARVRGAHKG